MFGEIIELKNDFFGGKVMDNRVGVIVLDMFVNRIKDIDLVSDLYLVGLV